MVDRAAASSNEPKYKKSTIVTTIIWVLLFILFTGVAFPVGGIAVLIFLIGFPLLAWAIIVYVTATWIFYHFIIRRKHFVLLRRLHILSPTQSDYFLVNAKFPESITWRFAQTTSVIFLVASTAVSDLPTSDSPAPLSETGPFLAAGIAGLCFVMPFVFLLWTYEDAGLRRYDRNSGTIGRVGAMFEQFLFGSGAATTFLRFLLTLRGTSAQIVGWAFAMFIILLPSCLAVTLIFHRRASLFFVKKVREMATKKGLPPERTVRLD